MKVVIDTNVVISGVFFGGFPRKVLEAVMKRKCLACASPEIIAEYQEVVEEMISRKKGTVRSNLLAPFVNELSVIQPKAIADICRDADDNKFLDCAREWKALYVVSGDNDLLVLKEFDGIKIITAKQFCDVLYGDTNNKL